MGHSDFDMRVSSDLKTAELNLALLRFCREQEILRIQKKEGFIRTPPNSYGPSFSGRNPRSNFRIRPRKRRTGLWIPTLGTLTLQSLLFSISLLFSFSDFPCFFLAFFLSFPRILGVPRREKPLLFLGKNPCFFQKKQGLEGQGTMGFSQRRPLFPKDPIQD